MKEWFTNAELKKLNLPGFPSSRRGIDKWFETRNIDVRFPAKIRERQGSGGGTERHISLLPKSVQHILQLRDVKTAEAPAMEEFFVGAAAMPEPAASASQDLRRDAILLILSFWDIYRNRFPGPIETARHQFCTLYAAAKIEGIPDWVKKALTTRNGRERSFCVNTLARWDGLRGEGKFAQLGGAYGNRAGTGILDLAEGGAVAQTIAALIVQHPHFTADHIRDMLQAKYGPTLKVGDAEVPLPPIRTIQRWVQVWKTEHQEALLKMTDPDGWKNKKKFSGRNMNAWVVRPNQLWEADASPADALLVDGRYAIYCVVDIYTRRMKVLVTKTPKTAAMLSLLRRCILDWGVPEILRTDNGSDFTSYEFRRAVTALAIHHDIADPFSPEQKGTVERHIGTIQRGLMPLLPGFIGHSVADRKKIEARKTFAQRLGETDEKAFCVELTHQQMQDAVNRWVEDKYHNKPHAGLGGQTPAQMLNSWHGPIRRVQNERALDLMLAPIAGKDGLRQVTKYGITLEKRHFLHVALVPGTTVLCRHDPEDLGRLYVYSEDGREFICVAECPELVGLNPGEAVRAVRDAQAERIKNEVKPLEREIRAMKPMDAIDAVLRVAAANAPNVTPFPKPTETYSTPGLEAAAQAISAEKSPQSTLSSQMRASVDRLRNEFAEDASTGVVAKLTTPKERYRRAYRLQASIKAGQLLAPDDFIWLNGYRLSSEYQTQAQLHEEFGDLFLGLAKG